MYPPVIVARAVCGASVPYTMAPSLLMPGRAPLRLYPMSTSHRTVCTITTTGALATTIVAASIGPLPPPPQIVQYPTDGKLHGPIPTPFTPSGGTGTNTNGSTPSTKLPAISITKALQHASAAPTSGMKPQVHGPTHFQPRTFLPRSPASTHTDKALDCAPAISQNRSIPLSYPGRQVFLQWDAPANWLG